jgi:hypothetical protein
VNKRTPPEAKKSHLARSLERERARRVLAHGTSKQREIERRKRKAARKRALREQTMQQQELGVVNKRRITNRALAPDVLREVLRIDASLGREKLISWFVANHYRGRKTKDPEKAAYSLIARAIGEGLVRPYVARAFGAMVRDLGQNHAIEKPVENAQDTRVKKLETRLENYESRMDQMFVLLTKLVTKEEPKQIDSSAEVLDLDWEKITQVINRASRDDGLYRERRWQLYGTFATHNNFKWEAEAKKLGLDTKTGSWHRAVANACGVTTKLLDLAIQLFDSTEKKASNT